MCVCVRAEENTKVSGSSCLIGKYFVSNPGPGKTERKEEEEKRGSTIWFFSPEEEEEPIK